MITFKSTTDISKLPENYPAHATVKELIEQLITAYTLSDRPYNAEDDGLGSLFTDTQGQTACECPKYPRNLPLELRTTPSALRSKHDEPGTQQKSSYSHRSQLDVLRTKIHKKKIVISLRVFHCMGWNKRAHLIRIRLSRKQL